LKTMRYTFRLFSVKFDRFLSAWLRRSPGKIFLSFSIIREYLSDSQRIPWVYHYSRIATLEVRVLISGSASFSEKWMPHPPLTVFRSQHLLSGQHPPCYVLFLVFRFNHPPLTGLHRRFLLPRPFLQSTSLVTNLIIGRSQKKLRLEKYSLCFHILKHFPFLILTSLAKTCSTLVHCSLNNFRVNTSIILPCNLNSFGFQVSTVLTSEFQ
jgi:hypothetical protein